MKFFAVLAALLSVGLATEEAKPVAYASPLSYAAPVTTVKVEAEPIEAVAPVATVAATPVSYAGAFVHPYAYAPYAQGSQFHAQDEFGNLNYGYTNINSAKQEVGNTYGGVTGGYSYVDADPAILAGYTSVVSAPTPFVHNAPVVRTYAGLPTTYYGAGYLGAGYLGAGYFGAGYLY